MFRALLLIATTATLSIASAVSPALACSDPDCGGLSAEELARDRAEVRRLNRQQKQYVDRRDAEFARGWAAQKEHAEAVAQHQRRMAEWREAVRRCRAGERRFCD